MLAFSESLGRLPARHSADGWERRVRERACHHRGPAFHQPLIRAPRRPRGDFSEVDKWSSSPSDVWMSAQPCYHSGRVKGIIANQRVEYALMRMSLKKQREPFFLPLPRVSPSIGWVNSPTGTFPVGSVQFDSKTEMCCLHVLVQVQLASLDDYSKLTWVSLRSGSDKCESRCRNILKSRNFLSDSDFHKLFWTEFKISWFSDDIRRIIIAQNWLNCRPAWKLRRHLLPHKCPNQPLRKKAIC